MRVFLDTNILLDIIEGRQKFLLASSNVFDLGIRGQIQMFATPLTFANCVYTARKNVGYEQAVKGLKTLKRYIQTAAMDDTQKSFIRRRDSRKSPGGLLSAKLLNPTLLRH